MKIGFLLTVVLAIVLGVLPARAETASSTSPGVSASSTRGSVDGMLLAFGLSDLSKATRGGAALPVIPVGMSCSPRGANTTKHCDCAATCISVFDDCICCGGPNEKECKDVINSSGSSGGSSKPK